jgi:hypothetical protein
MSIVLRLQMFVIAQSGAVPFQASPAPNAPGNVSQIGEIAGNGGVAASKAAGQLAVQRLENLWTELINPNGAFWGALFIGMNVLLAIGFVFWVGSFGWAYLYEKKVQWRRFIVPFVMIILLHNNGEYLAVAQTAGKKILYGTVNRMMDAQIDGVSARARLQEDGAQQAYDQIRQERLAACRIFSGTEKTNCETNAENQAREFANQINAPEKGIATTDTAKNPAEWLANAIGSNLKIAIIAAIISLLTTIAAAFHIFFGWVLTMWASISPIFLLLNLLPYPTPTLKILIAGWMACAIGMVSYTGLSIGASYLMATTGQNDPLFYALLSGGAAPVLGLGFAAGGFMGGFAGIGAVTQMSIRGGRKR